MSISSSSSDHVENSEEASPHRRSSDSQSISLGIDAPPTAIDDISAIVQPEGDKDAQVDVFAISATNHLVKETALNEADAASTVGRQKNFTPYNHHVHDPTLLRTMLDKLEADPAPEVKAQSSYRALEVRQAENNANPTCHDCLGMNQQSYFSGHGPSMSFHGLSALGASLSAAAAATAHTHAPPAAQHVGEESVLYPCGRHLTITHLTDSSTRRLIHTNDKVIGVVTYVVSSDGKYLAVSERYSDHTGVSIYRVDSGAKVSTLDYRVLAKTLVTELDFSSNNRFLVTVTAAPEHKLILWLLEEMRVVGLCEELTSTPISRIKFSGWHSHSLASICNSQLLLWTQRDRDITPIDVLSHHEQKKYQLQQQEMQEASGSKIDPSKRISPASVSRVQLFDGRLTNHTFVAVAWYEDKCFAALTEDGWLVAVEEDYRVKMCMRIGVPDRRNTIDVSAVQGSPATPTASTPAGSHRASTVFGFDSPPSTSSGLPPDNLGTGYKSFHGPNTAPSSHARSHPHQYLSNRFSNITWCSRGFLITGPQGWVTLIDRTYDEHVPFMQMANFSACPPTESILSLSVSPGESNVILALSSNQLSYVSLPELDDAIELARASAAEAKSGPTTARLGSAPPPSKGSASQAIASPAELIASMNTARGQLPTSRFTHTNSNMMTPSRESHSVIPESNSTTVAECGVVLSGEHLMRPMPHTQFHRSVTTSISLALQRPYLATSSADGTVTVYDYIRRKLVGSRTFPDSVVCCAMHPMGTQLVVCEAFTAGLYGVLDGGLVLLTVIGVRGAQFARFSANGGRIAFAVSTRVLLFNSSTLESMGMLVGHASNVKSVRWCDNDTRLTTCDLSGAVLSWNAFTCKRAGSENSHRNIIMSGVVGFPQQDNAFAAVGSTRQTRGLALENEFTIVGLSKSDGLVYIRPGMHYPRASVTRKFHTGLLCFSEVSRTLFVGTPCGRVLLYSWPLVRHSKPYRIIDAHEGEILHMILSHDEQFLFTVGADQLCFVYQLQHMKEGRYMSIPSFDYNLTDPVRLVGIEVQNRNIGAEVEVLNELIRFKGEDIAACQRTLKRDHEKLCSDMRQKAEKQIGALKAEISKTKETSKSLMEKGHAERRTADIQFQIASEAIESQYGRLSDAYTNKTEALKASKEQLIASFENAHTNAIRSWEDAKTGLEMARLEKEKQLANDLQRLQHDWKNQAKDSDAMLDQTIIDGERDLHRVQTEQAKVLQETLTAIQRVGHVQSYGEREADRLRKEIGSLKDDLITKAIIQNDLEKQTTQNAAKNAAHRNNNKLRQEEINVAEKSLQQLRQQLGTLENLRFVLIHQFEQLQSEIEPKESKLRQLERAIGEREGLLGHVHRERNELKEQVVTTTTRLTGANGAYRSTMHQNHAKGYGVTSVISELSKALDEFGGDGKVFHRHVREILERNALRAGPGVLTKAPTAEKGKFTGTNSVILKTPAEIAKAKQSHDELDRQAKFLTCQHQSLVRSMKEKTAIADITKQAFREENEQYLRDIRVLQAERKTQAEELKALESQLRDVRIELHTVVDSFNKGQQPEGANQAEKSTPLLPPLAGSSAAQATPTARAGASATTKSSKHFATLPPLRTAKTATETKTSPKAGAKKVWSLAKGNDNDGPSEDEYEQDDPSVGLAKPSRLASKAKRTAKERMAQRQQVQALIDQLDANTDTMRAQQTEAHRLRSFVKELLSTEELYVTQQVGQQIATDLRIDTSTAPAPMLLRIVADRKHQNALVSSTGDTRKLPRLMAPSISSAAVPRQQSSNPSDMVADEDGIVTDDREDGGLANEEVDWVGQQARPLTPVARPA